MDKIKVIVNGAAGKMGKEVINAVTNESDMEIVGSVDATIPGKDLTTTIKETKADVVVDFTIPSQVMGNIRTVANAGAHIIVGTTGLTKENFIEIKELAEKNNINVFIAPNFAIGGVLMMKFATEAAKYMPKAEIIELHHDQKLDAPSGTAIKTKEMMLASSDMKDIPIHSVRLPGFVAHQEVIFGGLGQTLTIRHDSISRDSFMPGVVLSIRKIKSLKGLVYGLEYLL